MAAPKCDNTGERALLQMQSEGRLYHPGRKRSPHLTFNRHLGLEIYITQIHSNHSNHDARKQEDGREYDGPSKFDEGHDKIINDSSEIRCNFSIDGGDILCTARDDASCGSLVEPTDKET